MICIEFLNKQTKSLGGRPDLYEVLIGYGLGFFIVKITLFSASVFQFKERSSSVNV